jgi:hypothetical protein
MHASISGQDKEMARTKPRRDDKRDELFEFVGHLLFGDVADVDKRAALNDQLGTFMAMCQVYRGVEMQDPPEPETTSCRVTGCNQCASATVKVGAIEAIGICDTHLARLNHIQDQVLDKGPALAALAHHQLTFDF